MYKIYLFVNKVLQILAGCILVGLILLVCGNIFFRIFWSPIRGTFELVGLFGAVMCGFSLAYTQDKEAHIAVDIIFKHFRRSVRKILNGINHLLCIFVFSVGCWKLTSWALEIKRAGELTETLRIVYYPFMLCLAFGFFLLVVSLAIGLYFIITQK